MKNIFEELNSINKDFSLDEIDLLANYQNKIEKIFEGKQDYQDISIDEDAYKTNDFIEINPDNGKENHKLYITATIDKLVPEIEAIAYDRPEEWEVDEDIVIDIVNKQIESELYDKVDYDDFKIDYVQVDDYEYNYDIENVNIVNRYEERISNPYSSISTKYDTAYTVYEAITDIRVNGTVEITIAIENK